MSIIKKLNSMDIYPTAYLKYVMDLGWDILQALQILMAKLKVPCDAPVSKTIWNTPNITTKALKRQTTNALSLDTWVNDDLDSDTVPSENTYEESSQEIDIVPSTTSRIGPRMGPS